MLVQWQHMTKTEATWEDIDKLQREFPTFNLEENVHFNGGGIDVSQEVKEGIEEEVEWIRKISWKGQDGKSRKIMRKILRVRTVDQGELGHLIP